MQKAVIEKQLGTPEIYQAVEKFRQTESDYQQLLKQIQLTETQYETVFETIIALESA
jgi:hypothetical protein